ncbi:MAG: hypothetical protein JO108_13405 [Acidobacteriaceae bacterium]|nr:hypothetical protein [Acidobacteriaceae bacterium]
MAARYDDDPVFRELERQSRFARVHVDYFDAQWRPERWDDGGGPDSFEIEIGNRIAHAIPLWEASNAFADRRGLAYYDEVLRLERLQMVRDACCLNIERVHCAVRRALHFFAFDRLYHAFQEFLQACSLRTAFTRLLTTNGSVSRWRGGWDYLHYMPSYIPC